MLYRTALHPRLTVYSEARDSLYKERERGCSPAAVDLLVFFCFQSRQPVAVQSMSVRSAMSLLIRSSEPKAKSVQEMRERERETFVGSWNNGWESSEGERTKKKKKGIESVEKRDKHKGATVSQREERRTSYPQLLQNHHQVLDGASFVFVMNHNDDRDFEGREYYIC